MLFRSREVVEIAQSAYGKGKIAWGDGSEGPHEAGWLALEIAKSSATLGVKPHWPLIETVRRTMRWYRQQLDGVDAQALCAADITAYEASSKTP